MFRYYVTETLRLRGENKYITGSWADMVRDQAVDTRTGDEIALEVIRAAGLKLSAEGEVDNGSGI